MSANNVTNIYKRAESNLLADKKLIYLLSLETRGEFVIYHNVQKYSLKIPAKHTLAHTAHTHTKYLSGLSQQREIFNA